MLKTKGLPKTDSLKPFLWIFLTAFYWYSLIDIAEITSFGQFSNQVGSSAEK